MIQPSVLAIRIAGAGVLLALVPVLGGGGLWPVWAAFWVGFLLLLAVDFVSAPPLGSWSVTLELPRALAVGADHRLTLELATSTARSFAVEALLDVGATLERPAPVRIAGQRGRGETELTLRGRRRGRAELEALWVRYRGPLGLLTLRRRLPLSLVSAVLPDLGLVRGAAVAFFAGRRQRAGLKIERYPGEGSEFESLREFLPGHDRRSVDWKASARHTKLLTREFRAERNHQIVLALDCGRLMSEPLEGLARLDHAVHAALALATIGLRTGDRVGLYAFDSGPRVFLGPRSGMGAFPGLALATRDLEYGTEETNFTLGLTDLSTRLSRRSLVVVLTDFVDAVTAELMLDNLARMGRRHLVLFVSLEDPRPAQLAGAPPRDLDALNRAVVAHSLRREREVALRRLRRRGVLLVDAPPRSVGSALISRYLHLKRREMI